jgi:hypothetical protein
VVFSSRVAANAFGFGACSAKIVERPGLFDPSFIEVVTNLLAFETNEV